MCLLLVAAGAAAQTHDFGEVARKGGDLVHRFELANEGAEPLVVLKTETGCSCVKVSAPRRPIAPGETGYIEVTYQVGKKPAGVFYKVIDVYTSSGRVSFIIKGYAISD